MFLVLYTYVVVWYNYVKVSMRYGFVLLLLLWLDGVVGCFWRILPAVGEIGHGAYNNLPSQARNSYDKTRGK